MKAKGLFCSNCRHCKPFDRSKTGLHCEKQYDHHGGWESHQPITPYDVCEHHEQHRT